MSPPQEFLAVSGLLLFTLGLINGVLIPMTLSPRLSLSAHLTAVQSGTFLIAIAWMWPAFGLADPVSDTLAPLLSGSLIILWLALFLSGVWNAGRDLPIAGQGATSTASRQKVVSLLLRIGSVGTLLSSIVLIVAWAAS